MFGVHARDLSAEGSCEPGLQTADFLLRLPGFMFGRFHLDSQRRCAERRLSRQTRDEPRLDLHSRVHDLRVEVVADKGAVNAGASRDNGRFEIVVPALVLDLGDHRPDALVLLSVDSALGGLHPCRAVSHAALPLAGGSPSAAP
jgi:hypothetical protein